MKNSNFCVYCDSATLCPDGAMRCDLTMEVVKPNQLSCEKQREGHSKLYASKTNSEPKQKIKRKGGRQVMKKEIFVKQSALKTPFMFKGTVKGKPAWSNGCLMEIGEEEYCKIAVDRLRQTVMDLKI